MGRQHIYNLEDRTYLFARECRLYVEVLPKTLGNAEDGKQLVRASGAVAACYVGTDERPGGKGSVMRAKMARKEVREAQYWLRLLRDLNDRLGPKAEELIEEAAALGNILSSIIDKKRP